MRAAAPLTAVLLLVAACDHTRLTGRIVPDRERVRVGEALRLTLEVPPELSAVHKVIWEIEPADAGEIGWTRGERGSVVDRDATLTPRRAGEIEVRAFGFYRQTNPQPITSLRVRVDE